jgi:Uma2 family endonuclease
MVTKTGRRMSLEEFLALPEEKPNLELIDGEVCQKPMGKRRHSRAQSRLYKLLSSHRATSGGEAFVELTLPIGGNGRANARVPDVSYYQPGRGGEGDDYPTELPDLVAEVRSEGQTVRALESRLAFLRERGVLVTLLIDPENVTITVHDGGRSWVAGAGERVVLQTHDGFEFGVDELFEP